MNEDLDLLNIELCMLECAEDNTIFFMESKIEDYCKAIIEQVQTIIDHMIAYVKNIKTDISVFAAKTATKAKLLQLRNAAKNGASVSIPDFSRVEYVYKNACSVLPAELNRLLTKAKRIKSSSDLDAFIAKKENFERQLESLERSFDEVLSNKKTYDAKDAYVRLNDLLNNRSIYINTYYKAIREFDHFKNDYEIALKEAQRKNDSLGKRSLAMHKSLLSRASTSLSRLLKKSIFAIAAITI